MTPRTARRVAWALFGLTLFGAVVQFALRLPRLEELADRYDPFLTFPIITLATLAAALVGAFIVSRHPRNPVGWLFCITNCIAELGLAAVSYAELSGLRETPLPGAPYAAWFQTLTAAAFALTGLALLLLLFPQGRLPSPRWRVVVWLLGVNFVVMQVATLLLVGDPRDVVPLQELPPGRRLSAVVAGTQLVVVGCVVAAAVSIGVRRRRAAGDERQQLRLVSLAAAAVGVSVVFMALYESVFEARGVSRLVPETLFYLSYGTLPVAAGLAILKYRLYDIDVILNRALVFTGLLMVSTVGYIGVVVALGSVVGDQLHLGTMLNLLVTAGVAVAVQPARRKVHLIADRIAYGRKAAPYDVLAGFTARIAGTLTVEDVLPQMAASAARGVGARSASVYVTLPDGSERSVVWPAPQAGSADVHVPVHHLDEQVGRLELWLPPGGRLSSASTELLAHLARQAGVALHNVRLTDELRWRLRQLSDHNEAVAASRQRLVAARTVERQRLERQIADLVQPHLARVRSGLGEVESAVSDPQRAGQLVESLAAEATSALESLRDLARGVFPPLLVDHGLLPALQAAARTAPAPVTVDVESPCESGDVGLPRYEAVIESAAYFCLRDVLSAATPHAPVQVTLRPTAERLGITVGGVEPPPSVLASVSDRAGATGGTVAFGWAPRPTVVVELPVGSVRHVLATADT